MKYLIALLLFSANTVALACNKEEIPELAMKQIEEIAKSNGAKTFIAGPGFGNGSILQFPFSFVGSKKKIQLGDVVFDLNSCSAVAWGLGDASVHSVK